MLSLASHPSNVYIKLFNHSGACLKVHGKGRVKHCVTWRGKKKRYTVIGMEIDDKFRDKGTREKGDGWI